MTDREEEARLRAVVDTAVDGVILIDARGIVQMFNPACARMFGYGADEVLGRNVKMLMPSPYRDEHDRYIGNYHRTGERKIIGIGREVMGQRKDGSVFPMELSVGEARQNGESIFVGILHDVTDRYRAEQALRESAARLAAVVDTAVDGVILIDARGNVQMFNPACERLFGYGAEEVLGRNVKMLMPSPYRDEHDRYIDNHRRTGERKIIGIGREVVGQRKDGSVFPMELSVGEAKQERGSIYVGVIHDITDRKRVMEQLVQAQKMETVGQLSGGIAHDFNNLLTIIIGNAETLSLSLKARPDLKSLADMIVSAGERGASLTQRLLAFSRRQTLRPESIDCNAMLVSLQQLLRRTLREDVAIKITPAPDLWQAVADPAQLESAVLNLALNAQDAMPRGGTLAIATSNIALDASYTSGHLEVKPGRYVVLAVTDDGTGMAPEVLRHAFEPFFTTKEVGKGSGLGLSMVYGFVKQSNGHITIYSDVGLGTTVRIYLPAGDAPVDAPVADATPTLPPVGGGSRTVLVVEDDPFVRVYAVASLESMGFRVLSAVDGPEAMTRLSQDDTIELLFTDVVMPGGMSGLELAERARAARPGLKVLLTSGYALETLTARGRMPDRAVLLNKPYRKAALARAVHEAMESV